MGLFTKYYKAQHSPAKSAGWDVLYIPLRSISAAHVRGVIGGKMRFLIVMLLLPLASFSFELEDIYEKENKLAIESLLALNPDKEFKGIVLTDNSIWLKGYSFLKINKSVQKGLLIYLFNNPYGAREAVLFVDGGEPFLLPVCKLPEHQEGQYGISGDIYTSKYIEKKDGVVLLKCPPSTW